MRFISFEVVEKSKKYQRKKNEMTSSNLGYFLFFVLVSTRHNLWVKLNLSFVNFRSLGKFVVNLFWHKMISCEASYTEIGRKLHVFGTEVYCIPKLFTIQIRIYLNNLTEEWSVFSAVSKKGIVILKVIHTHPCPAHLSKVSFPLETIQTFQSSWCWNTQLIFSLPFETFVKA